MLVAAAVCPHPPLLVPEVAAGAAAETEDLRRTAITVVAELADADPDVLVVVGDGPEHLAYAASDWGDLAGFGVRRTVRLGPGLCAGQAILPLSITLGAWMLEQAGHRGDRQALGVPAGTDADSAAALGAEVGSLDRRVALLVMGDGSARRSERAPGGLDTRAAAYDAEAAAALAAADPAAVLALDPALGRDLLVAGRASWQVLAGAAQAAGGAWRGELRARDCPYGVDYLVASWRPR